MRVTERMKKWISMILCLCMLVQNAPMMVFAASTDNLCDHHPKHTEDCGYVEAVAGSACTHKHSEACYKIVECKHTCSDECGDPCTTHTCTVDDGCITMERDCHHVHGECGYAEAVEPQDCTTCQPVLVHAQNCGYVAPVAEETCDCVPGEDGTVTHIEGCGYVAPVEEEKCDCEPTVTHGGEGCTYVEGKDGSPCTHVCAVVVDSADSCYKLLCSHKDGGHDDACGYAAAVEGHACHYECSACEDNAGDSSPVPEGICAHGNSEESCETCVGEIQVMINALPDMEDIGDHNRADVISQLEAIDDRMWKLSDAAKGKLNADKYVDAAFVLSAPEGFFGFLLTKRYEAGASAMPQASFAFLDASGAAATVIIPEEQQTTSMEPVSNGGAVRGYLPVGEYTLDETVVGDWNLAMSVNGQAEGDHTFTGEGGRAYRIETVNTNKPCEHTAEMEENKATCKKQAVCDLCGNSYGAVNKNNHDASVAFDNGFCPNGCYESAKLVDGVYQISNAGQLYWFAEQVNFKNPSINGKLMEDILVNENVLNSEGTVSSDLFRKWYPIGSTEYGVEFKYSGTFNGNGKTISGLYFDDNNEDGVGLFGYVDSGKIQNVGIKDSYFNGNVNVGSVVAHNYQGTVTGCYNTGTVSGGNTVGGVVGKNEEGTVTDCYNSGRIGSRLNNVGGVLGGNIGTVSGCYNTGSISGQDCVGGVAGYSNGSATDCYNTGKVDGNEMVGGVLGLNESGSTLSNCYNTGEVNGQFWVGGVLGLNHVGSKLINCYNTGEVGEGFCIGGVLGRNERGSTLINCYNTGEVIGSLSVGGVAGENVQGTIDYCYYLTGSTTRGIGEGNGTTEDKTEEAFASGEVACLLGEPFGQNIDNDQPKQEIPCFSNAKVYAVQNCNYDTVYSNTNEGIGHKWKNGVCSICEAPCSHNSFNSDTGECQYCETEMAVAMVEIGGTPTTYFETLAGAVTKAETGTADAPAILTLLKDIDQGASYQQIDSGVFTLDLNGCTLAGTNSSNGVLYLNGCNITITDGSTEQDGTITAIGVESVGVHANSSSSVTISGGTILGNGYCVKASSNSTVEISGGTILGQYYVGLYADGGTVKISGGTITGQNSDLKVSGTGSITLGLGEDKTGATFPDGLRVIGPAGTTSITLKAILGEGAAYWKDGKMISLSDGQKEITGGDVTVKAVCKHENATYSVEGNNTTKHKVVCLCGYENLEDHTFDSTTGKCQYCETKMAVASVKIGENTTYYKTLAEAVTKAETGTAEAPATLTLLENIALEDSYRQINSGVFTLDLNGCTLEGSGSSYGVLYLNGCNITITDGSTEQDGTISGYYGVNAHNNSTVTITGGTISGNMDGVNAVNSTVKISGGTITGSGTSAIGVNVVNSTVEISSGTISGYCGVYAASNSTVKISRGTITGTNYGVYAYSNSAVTINGGEISGTEYGVYASGGTANISGGKISATGEKSYGVYADESSEVEISGGDVSGEIGVNANNKSTVTIEDGTISGYCGVFADKSTVKISGGTISGNAEGVIADKSTVTIKDGTISGGENGVYAFNSAVTISGGKISATGDYCVGVYASGGNVEISGGEISGAVNDLGVLKNGSITLTLAKGATKGATFPGGLTVDGTTLNAILREGAAYWQGTQMIFPSDGQTEISDGDVTVKAVCKHETATYSVKDVTDTTKHKVVCSCGYENLEDHTFNDTDGKCSKCKTDLAEASVKIGDTTTYYETLGAAITAAESCVEADNAVVTLLKDIALGESYQKIESGVFTLDLNGCELAGSHSSYGVLYLNGCNITITDGSDEQDGTITGTNYGVGAYNSTVNISRGTITGDTGVYVNSRSTVKISGGSISASDYGVHSLGGILIVDGGTITGDPGMQVTSGTLTISGGTIISSAIGVNVLHGIVTISGGTISGYCGVDASSDSNVEISGGTITATGNYCVGVDASSDSNVEISGGTITATGDNCVGVDASINSTVEITGGEISGNGEHSVGVYADESTVKISVGEISATGEESSGVYASVNSNVTISDGTITGTNYGVEAYNSTVTISGGEVSATDTYSCGVYANKSTVKISGGEISGEANDLRVLNGGSITLGLGEDKTGATFPGDLKVSGTTLKACLGEGAAYWQNGKMIIPSDGATNITGGDVTVKAVCKHENTNYSGDSNNATEHKIVCSECDNVLSSEPHTRTYTASGNVITASCSQCKATFGTATITANGKTYNGEPVTAAVQKTGVLSGSNIGITYSQNGEELNESAIRAGTYTASIKLGDAVAKVDFTITPATLPNAVLSETGYTYNGQQQKPAVTVTGLTENTDYTVTYPQDVTNAGEKTVTITGKGNYTGTVTKSYSIAKADSVVTKAPQAAANLVYNGKNQNLVIAGTVTGGTLRYSLDGKTWTATIPVGKAAGTYTVSYKVVGDGNHKDIAVRTLAVTIAKGTAPAVDALVQTHFYAYATANTVDLAKYLPADRGTTAYTAIGVSADIFSSVPTVTNAGVLSYTTRKLTAAPASDTQIRIRVVMENYADAELTVTVKLLAVTEQTQQKIVKTELTEVPAGLAGTRFHSVDAIKTEQTRVLGSLLGYDPQGNILHYDVKLQFSPDGGKTWVDATEENFPANGLTVTLPYPSGTGKDTHNFVVSHMFTTGAKAGTTETPAVTKTADGIRFTVTGLSPVSVACSAIPFDVKVANVTNGTVYVSSAQATAGTQVTITATPKSGYRLSSLAVKDAAGNSYTVSTDNNGKYYFIMPAADVTVTATFTAKSTAVADTTNPKTGDDFPILFWSGMMMTTLLGAAALMLNKQKFYER